MKPNPAMAVVATDKFLTWHELIERAGHYHPVMVSCLRGGESWSYGCIPKVDGNTVLLNGLSLAKKLCGGDRNPIAMLGVGPLRVSVIEGEFISRVVVRVAGLLSIQESSRSLAGRIVAKSHNICLYIDEPVDPSGARCLFSCGGVWGGADADWVDKQTLPPLLNLIKDLEFSLSATVKSFLPHVKGAVFLDSLPKNPHEIRRGRAAGIWKEWDRVNENADHCKKHSADTKS